MADRRFTIIRQYIKDISFELFLGSEIFSMPWQPQTHVEIGTQHTRLGDDEYESALEVTVTVTLDGKPAYLIEVKQAGLFKIVDSNPDELDKVLGILCPTYLFPYLREVVDTIATRSGVLPIGLQPVDFESEYLSRLESDQ